KVIREYAPTNPENVAPNNNLELDLGLDSMRRVELLVALQQELGSDVPEAQLSDIYTVRELVDAITSSAASGAGSARNIRASQAFVGWRAVLKEAPADPRALAITKPRPLVDRIIFVLTRVVKLFWKSVSRLDVEGLENIPKQGPYLLCS